MGLFSRRKDSAEGSDPATPASSFIGRKFRSNMTVADCIANYSVVKSQCYSTVGETRDQAWKFPSRPDNFTSSQGDVVAQEPVRLLVDDIVGGGRIWLAIWDGTVSYNAGQPGPPCEMWFVPPDFDTSPIPIAGRWKSLDSSLSSIGWVEAEMWGA